MKNLTFILLFALFVFSACQPNQKKQTGDNKIKIVTTTGMIADIAKAVAGDRAEVVSLMGAGVDPHLYKATQGDLKLLKQADIILYNGLHLEGKMGEVLEKMAKFPNKIVVAVAEKTPKEKQIIVDEKNNIPDPHIWFDVDLWADTTPEVIAALVSLDNDHQKQYVANGHQKMTQLKELNQWVKNELSKIPEERRTLITAHDAFAYFGKAYNVQVQGLQGISTLSEAGIKDVTNLVNKLVEEKVPAVFVESSVPKKALEAVVEGAKEKGHQVKIGGTLYSDAMGEEGTPEGTYEGMVRHNIRTIVDALK